MSKEEKILFDRPLIDSSKCNGCGVCVEVCYQAALIISGGKVKFAGVIECPWCGECEAVCPRGAISCPYEIVFPED